MALLEATWTAPLRGGTSDVLEPATGESLGSVSVATVEDVAAAAIAASLAQRDWARRTPEDRAAVLRRAGLLFAGARRRDRGLDRARDRRDPAEGAARDPHRGATSASRRPPCRRYPHGDVLTSNEPRWSFARRLPGRAW